jgi:hypothetical protein
LELDKTSKEVEDKIDESPKDGKEIEVKGGFK